MDEAVVGRVGKGRIRGTLANSEDREDKGEKKEEKEGQKEIK